MSEKILLKESNFKELDKLIKKNIKRICKNKKISLINNTDILFGICNKIMIKWFNLYYKVQTETEKNKIVNAINYDIGKEINNLINNFRKNNKIENKNSKEIKINNSNITYIKDENNLKNKYNKIFNYIDKNFDKIFGSYDEYKTFKKFIHLLENNNNISNIKHILNINNRTIKKYKDIFSKVNIIIENNI